MDIQEFLTQLKSEIRPKQGDQLILPIFHCQNGGDKLQQKYGFPRDTQPSDQIVSETKKLDTKKGVLPFLGLRRGVKQEYLQVTLPDSHTCLSKNLDF